MKSPSVLNVDDNEDDQLLLRRAWKKSALPLDFQMVGDGEKAIEYLAGREAYADRELFPMPIIVLLDLKMPRKNGFEVLEWINRELPTERPPVAVFTSSQAAPDIDRAYELGARWYFSKPVDFTELTQWVRLIGQWCQDPQAHDPSDSPHYRARRSGPHP